MRIALNVSFVPYVTYVVQCTFVKKHDPMWFKILKLTLPGFPKAQR